MSVYTSKIETPIGSMIAYANEEGICLLEFNDRPDLKKQVSAMESALQSEFLSEKNGHLLALAKQLGEYFRGERETFDLPLVFTGTPFQEKVWNALLDISFGKITSYQRLTNSLGDPKAIRAVAAANGANKLAILVPCHRVIGSDGNLTGYAGGVSRKKFLLELESKQLQFDI